MLSTTDFYIWKWVSSVIKIWVCIYIRNTNYAYEDPNIILCVKSDGQIFSDSNIRDKQKLKVNSNMDRNRRTNWLHWILILFKCAGYFQTWGIVLAYLFYAAFKEPFLFPEGFYNEKWLLFHSWNAKRLLHLWCPPLVIKNLILFDIQCFLSLVIFRPPLLLPALFKFIF